jgi:hypothetical protein
MAGFGNLPDKHLLQGEQSAVPDQSTSHRRAKTAPIVVLQRQHPTVILLGQPHNGIAVEGHGIQVDERRMDPLFLQHG